MEIVVPVAFLYETIKWLTENNLILKEKLFRAIVQDATDKGPVSMANIFSGKRRRYLEQLYNPIQTIIIKK